MPPDMQDCCVVPDERPQRIEFSIEAFGQSLEQAMRTVCARFLRAADQVGLPGRPTEVFVTDDEYYQYWTFVPVEPDPNRSLQVGSQSFIPEMLVGRTDILAASTRFWLVM
jgi:hypothetical protein